MALSSDLTWKALLKLTSQVEYVMLGPHIEPSPELRKIIEERKAESRKKIIGQILAMWDTFEDHKGFEFTIGPAVYVKTNGRQEFVPYDETKTYDWKRYSRVIYWQFNNRPGNTYALFMKSPLYKPDEYAITNASTGTVIVKNDDDAEDCFLQFLKTLGITDPPPAPHYTFTKEMFDNLTMLSKVALFMRFSMLNDMAKETYVNDLKLEWHHPKPVLHWSYLGTSYYIQARTVESKITIFVYRGEQQLFKNNTAKGLAMLLLINISKLPFTAERLLAADQFLKIQHIVENAIETLNENSSGPEDLIMKLNGKLSFDSEFDMLSLDKNLRARIELLLDLASVMQITLHKHLNGNVLIHPGWRSHYDNHEWQFQFKIVDSKPLLRFKCSIWTAVRPFRVGHATCEITFKENSDGDNLRLMFSKIFEFTYNSGVDPKIKPRVIRERRIQYNSADGSERQFLLLMWDWYWYILEGQHYTVDPYIFPHLNIKQFMQDYHTKHPTVKKRRNAILSLYYTKDDDLSEILSKTADKLNEIYQFSKEGWADVAKTNW